MRGTSGQLSRAHVQVGRPRAEHGDAERCHEYPGRRRVPPWTGSVQECGAGGLHSPSTSRRPAGTGRRNVSRVSEMSSQSPHSLPDRLRVSQAAPMFSEPSIVPPMSPESSLSLQAVSDVPGDVSLVPRAPHACRPLLWCLRDRPLSPSPSPRVSVRCSTTGRSFHHPWKSTVSVE